MTDDRERRLEDLQTALDENTKSKAIDKAARFAVRMRGGTTGVPTGNLATLLELAEEQGSVTPAEIADVLSTDEIPIAYEAEWSVGEE